MKQSRQTSQTVTIEVDYVTSTDKAWLFMIEGKKQWVPKSKCEFIEDGLSQEAEIDRDFAIKESII